MSLMSSKAELVLRKCIAVVSKWAKQIIIYYVDNFSGIRCF